MISKAYKIRVWGNHSGGNPILKLWGHILVNREGARTFGNHQLEHYDFNDDVAGNGIDVFYSTSREPSS